MKELETLKITNPEGKEIEIKVRITSEIVRQ